jgi:hypothetical protein
LRPATVQNYSGQLPNLFRFDFGINAAIGAVQEKKLVWRAARGVYAIEGRIVANLLSADGLLEGLE